MKKSRRFLPPLEASILTTGALAILLVIAHAITDRPTRLESPKGLTPPGMPARVNQPLEDKNPCAHVKCVGTDRCELFENAPARCYKPCRVDTDCPSDTHCGIVLSEADIGKDIDPDPDAFEKLPRLCLAGAKEE